MSKLSRCVVVLMVSASTTAAQDIRPVPYPVMPPPAFERAVANGTRTITGEPGPNYWQNHAEYDFDVALEPDTRTVRGEGTITLHNQSPDVLRSVIVKLRQNVHAPGVVRNRSTEVTGGVTIDKLSWNESVITETNVLPSAGEYAVNGTLMEVVPPEPVGAGERLSLDVAWHFRMASVEGGTFREGTDDEVYYVGYWYPQFAVYDDVVGWHRDPYMGNGEHYMNFADYEVSITAPEDFLVYATGDLLNAEEVLTAQTRERLEQSLRRDGTTNIVTAAERGSTTRDAADDVLTWEFSADNVRDFAWAGSDLYVWDAARAMVDQDGDGSPEAVAINSFYRPERTVWQRSAEFAAFSIENLSERNWAYPWPHMTAIEGIIGGGMEYPMMTVIGGYRNDQSLFGVTYHEIAHMWYPMMVGQDEKGYTWMDEGLATFNTNEGRTAFFDGSSDSRPLADGWARQSQGHYRLAGTGMARPPMRHNDRYPSFSPARGTASYSTPAVLLHAMEDLFGSDAFWTAYREYGKTWAFKHPYPYDMMNSYERSLKQDLDWLWTPTLFETWTVDVGIKSVEDTENGVNVTVEDKALAPMPVRVTVTYADGTTSIQTIPVKHWLEGAREATLSFPAGVVARVELPTDRILDIDPSNNVYEPTM